MRQRMKVFGALLVMLVALLVMAIPPALAAPPHPGLDPNVGPKGNKNAIMYLTQKIMGEPGSDPNYWMPDVNGAWGKLRHNQSGETFDFTFNGYDLQPYTAYALIYKPGVWNDDKTAVCFGVGESDSKGSVTIKPFSSANFGPGGVTYHEWLWLVKVADLGPYGGWSCTGTYDFGLFWEPSNELFAYWTVEFTDTSPILP